MKYRVVIATEAQANIASAYDYIAEDSVEAAAKWVRGLYQRIETLENLPRKCAAAREQAYSDVELRQLIYKSHRVIFTVIDRPPTVTVVYIRHSRMRTVGEPAGDD